MLPTTSQGIIYAAALGATPTLSVSVDVTNERALNKSLANIRQFMKLDGKSIKINLVHKNGKTQPTSMLKNINTSETDIENILSVADRVISSWYRKPPVGVPFRERVIAAKAPIDKTIRKTIQEHLRGKKGVSVHNRETYMEAVRDSMLPVFRGNDLYSNWVRLVTA